MSALNHSLSGPDGKNNKLVIRDKFMKSRILGLCLLGVTLLSGCAGTPQVPVVPDQAFWQQPSKRVGVIVSEIPKPNLALPGASCLLCMAAAEVANSSLSSHAETLSVDDVRTVGADIGGLLESRDIEVVEISEAPDLSDLPDYSSEVPNSAKRDFSTLADKYNISHLLVLNVNAIGMQRTYSSYIPTSDPKGYFNALGYLVDLSNNTYKWYRPVQVTKAVTEKWDEPPTFPALTNAYYQAIAEGKEVIISSLDKQSVAQ